MRGAVVWLLLAVLVWYLLTLNGTMPGVSDIVPTVMESAGVPEADLSYDRQGCDLQRDRANWQNLSVIEKLAAARCEIPEDQLVPPP